MAHAEVLGYRLRFGRFEIFNIEVVRSFENATERSADDPARRRDNAAQQELLACSEQTGESQERPCALLGCTAKLWLALASSGASSLDYGRTAAAGGRAAAGASGMEKNPKACEPCRRRKVRCNGQTPCNRCDRKPADCVYRLRTRIRKSNAQRAAAAAAAAAGGGATDPAKAPHPPPPVAVAAEVRSSVSTATAAGGEQPTPHPSSAGHDSPSGFRRGIPESGEGPTSDSAIYQSIAAVPQRSDVEPVQGGTARLFYGPASQFAFLQQVHRGVLSSTGPHGQPDREVQEGGPGLDLFLQRSFFFGTAPRFDATGFHRPASTIFPELPLAQAKIFLEKYKAWSAHTLPFFTNVELDKMLHHLYNSDETKVSQTKALMLAVLALGALATPHTDLAEEVMARAKYEASLFDDTVSLPMIQYSLLLAEYQTSMGRPNLTYLMLGTACRKAFALGLHREAANSLTRPEDAEKCRTTLWCLYYQESWYTMMVGRESMLKMSDISSPFPENQPFIVTLSRLAYIGEQCSKTIYNTHRYDSLRKLFIAAEDIHAQLRDFANKNGIGPASLDSNGQPSDGEHPLRLLLHNLYYHTILLTFRPFLVADYALASSPSSQDTASAMWLRQACRQATNTAQDCIMYCYSQLQRDEVCRTSRYHGFFLESSCAVLFFDILRHPSKYAYNIEFIQMAIASVNLMIDDEPVTNARNSLKKILRVVEDTISKQKIAGTTTATTSGLPAFTDPLLQTGPNPSLPSPASSFMGGGQDHHHQQRQQQQQQQQQQTPQQQYQQQQQQQQQSHGTIQFPSLQAPPSSANQLIYFSDLPGSLGSTDTSMGGTPLGMAGLGTGGDADAFGGEGLDPLTHFHYDVLTTDLFNFFPLNMTPPSAAGSADPCPLENGGGPGA
ncbi:hypothetical protein diail_9920 [Diaporthe ilicicola]|nr:hypothetical protein diail_9920 [Diaporthe ilicicola]